MASTSTTGGILARYSKWKSALKLSAESEALFPFIPRSAKLFLFIIFLINVRSWPGVWHARVLSSVIRLRVQRLFYGQKNKHLWWRQTAPIGQSLLPIPSRENKGVEIVSKFWAAPDDCDWNGHMSNSSYAKNLDPLRMRVVAEWFPALSADGGWIGLGGAHYHWIREIPMGASYEIRLSLGGWENKWAYLVAKFVTHPNPSHKKSHNKLPIKPAHNGTSTLRTHDEDGALIHCVTVSTLCAKHGRVTIPPNVAFAVSGFSLSEPGSDKNWTHATALRAKGPEAMQHFLRGGWKDISEGERWWEPSDEVEKERAKRAEVLNTLVKSMDGLRM